MSSFPYCKHFKIIRPQNLQGIDFTSFKKLCKLDLSYCDSKMKSIEIKSNVLNFFYLLKEVPSLVNIVRVDLPKITLATLTFILVENFQRENVSDLLEFRVDRFTTKTESIEFFEKSVLSQMYKISKHSCKLIPDIQSYKIAYYFHPISKPNGEEQQPRTKEIRLIINKGLRIDIIF